jgi:hypothetical protein
MRQEFTNANYESIADFLAAVELPCRHKGNTETHAHFLDHNRYTDWYGADCHTGRDVVKLMQDGWPQGRERLNELRSKIGTVDLVPVDRRRRMTRADHGDVLDMTAVWSGRLDVAWRTARRTATTGPQKIELVANMICYGCEHSDVLFWRGAAAAVLADLLEQAGYMVRLVVNFGGNAGKEKTSCRIIVKEHGIPFDVTSTSAVILPGFFRALGHAWIANHAPYERGGGGGIGVGEGLTEPGEIVLSHKVRDHGTALAFVHDTIARINAGTELIPA